MPKRAASSVQSVRFELQDSERDMASYLTASMAFRNVGQGVGAVITPIADNIVKIMAVIITHEGFQFLEDRATAWQQTADDNRREFQLAEYQSYLEATDDDPIKSFDEWLTGEPDSYGLFTPQGWQRKVGDPIRRTIRQWGDILSPFS